MKCGGVKRFTFKRKRQHKSAANIFSGRSENTSSSLQPAVKNTALRLWAVFQKQT